MANKSTTGSSSGDRLAESFGARLASLRNGAGISATELGRRAGMSQAYVWRLEAGRAHPNLRTMARLALALEVALPALVEDIDCGAVSLESRSYGSDR